MGKIQDHPVLGRLDSAENILANKVTALLDREEPKDLADIWGFCCRKNLSLQNGITNAQSKAAGVFPADLARVLCSVQPRPIGKRFDGSTRRLSMFFYPS